MGVRLAGGIGPLGLAFAFVVRIGSVALRPCVPVRPRVLKRDRLRIAARVSCSHLFAGVSERRRRSGAP
jgi:hypothetical protein